MHPEIRDLIADAQALTRTYVLALNTSGQEIIELLDAGVTYQRIANLYPYELEQWSRGIERLIWPEPSFEQLHNPYLTESQRSHRRLSYPSALSESGWLICRSLTRSLSPEIPYFNEAQRDAYRRIGKAMSTGDDPSAHIYVLIMLLHVIATSSSVAAELKDSKVRRYARTTLIAAEALTQDPNFAAPVEQSPQVHS